VDLVAAHHERERERPAARTGGAAREGLGADATVRIRPPRTLLRSGAGHRNRDCAGAIGSLALHGRTLSAVAWMSRVGGSGDIRCAHVALHRLCRCPDHGANGGTDPQEHRPRSPPSDGPLLASLPVATPHSSGGPGSKAASGGGRMGTGGGRRGMVRSSAGRGARDGRGGGRPGRPGRGRCEAVNQSRSRRPPKGRADSTSRRGV
jgi:hypothetical protein